MSRMVVPGMIALLLCGSASAQGELDYRALKTETLVFEKILDERLKLDFADPFAIPETSRASYLRGYGVVISFRLNINRYRIRTPFGEVQPPQQGQFGRAKREEQIQKVKDIAINCLADYSSAIRQLNAHDRISISAHIDDRNELDPSKKTTILVITASKDAVDLLAMKKKTLEEFGQEVSIVEY